MEPAKPSSTPAPPEQPSAHSVDRGYSLGALFLLTAAAAVLLAGAAPVVRLAVLGEVRLGRMILASLATMCGGALLGFVLGMHRYHRKRGALMGTPLGAAIGLVAGPLCVLPGKLIWPVALSMFVGCIMLTAASVVMRPKPGAVGANDAAVKPSAGS